MRRRPLLAAPLLLLAPARPRAAAPWPSRPIRFVIPWPEDSAAAAVARLVGAAMSPRLGGELVYEYGPQELGAEGDETVARSPSDGHAILLAGARTFYRPLLRPDTPLDPDRDFDFVGPIGDAPFALVVRNGLPRDLLGFVAHARANPGRLNMASTGQGGTSHLAGELFNRMAGIEAVHVPYRGSAPALTDLVGSRVDYGFDTLAAVQEHALAQRIALLGISTPDRVAMAAGVPTIAEAGAATPLARFVAAPWLGICCPAGVTAPVVRCLAGALAAALAQPEVVAGLAGQGCRAFSLGPASFAEYVRAEQRTWAGAIAAAGLRPG